MKIILVGGGNLVYFVGRAIVEKGHGVTIIVRNKPEAERISRAIKATVVQGDGSKPSVLRDAGAAEADAVLAITPRDEDNLVICELARNHFRAKRAFSLVNDPDNEPIFHLLGVEETFSTTSVLAGIIEERTALDSIINLYPAAEGKVSITRVDLDSDAPSIGRPVQELGLPRDALVASVERDEVALIPKGDTALESGDRLILVTLPAQLSEALKVLTGRV